MPECPEQPVIGDLTATGGPFLDCGLGPTGFKSPVPTALPHAFSDGHLFTNTSLCVTPFQTASWWANFLQTDLPNLFITGNHREIHNSAVFPGDVVFTGHHVKWISQPGFGAATGEYVCAPGANMIEVDGECLCPVPEPSVTVGLLVSVLFMAVARTWNVKRRSD